MTNLLTLDVINSVTDVSGMRTVYDELRVQAFLCFFMFFMMSIISGVWTLFYGSLWGIRPFSTDF